MTEDCGEVFDAADIVHHLPFCLGSEKSWEDIVSRYAFVSGACVKSLFEYVEGCFGSTQKKIINEIRRKYESGYEALAQENKAQQAKIMSIVRQIHRSGPLHEPSETLYWLFLAFGKKTLENAHGCQAIKDCVARHNLAVSDILHQLGVKYHNDENLVPLLKSLILRLDNQRGFGARAGDSQETMAFTIRQRTADMCRCDSSVESFLKEWQGSQNDGSIKDGVLSLKASSAGVKHDLVRGIVEGLGGELVTAPDIEIYDSLDSVPNDKNPPRRRDSPSSILIADVVKPVVGIGDENPWVMFFVYRHTRADRTTIHIFDFGHLRGIDFQSSLDKIRKILGIRELRRHQHSIRIETHLTDHFLCPADSGLCLLYLMRRFLTQKIYRQSPELLQDGRAGWIRDLKSSFEHFNPCSVKLFILEALESKFHGRKNTTPELTRDVRDCFSQNDGNSCDGDSLDEFWTQPVMNGLNNQLDGDFTDSSQTQTSEADSFIPSSSHAISTRRGTGSPNGRGSNGSQLSRGTPIPERPKRRCTSHEFSNSTSRECNNARSPKSRQSNITIHSPTSQLGASGHGPSGVPVELTLGASSPHMSKSCSASQTQKAITTVSEMPALMFYGNTPPSAQIPGSSASDLQRRIQSVLKSRKRSRTKDGGKPEDLDIPSQKRPRHSECPVSQRVPNSSYGLNGRPCFNQVPRERMVERVSESASPDQGHGQEQQLRHLELQRKVKALEAAIRQQSAELSKLTEEHSGTQPSAIHVPNATHSADNYRPARR